jgi:hypothetical protein
MIFRPPFPALTAEVWLQTARMIQQAAMNLQRFAIID